MISLRIWVMILALGKKSCFPLQIEYKGKK